MGEQRLLVILVQRLPMELRSIDFYIRIRLNPQSWFLTRADRCLANWLSPLNVTREGRFTSSIIYRSCVSACTEIKDNL